jgi:amino acid adenylation domain-containing protein/FkbM family methyltransferase
VTLLHQLFEEQAGRTPDARAVVFEQNALTYAELDRRANRLASHLRTLGAGPDVLVALFVERSLDTVIGILGILKAGGAYLPIDPAQPAARVASVLEDARVTAMVTQAALLELLPERAPNPVPVDTFVWSKASADSAAATPGRPEHLAYVIYTSASTGRPKGVCVEHRQIVNYVRGVSERFRFEPGMHHATVSTVAADLGNTVIFPALATGGCLHVVARERTESPALLAEYFSRERIDVLKIVPSHLAALQTGRVAERVMPRRRLILGGEASRLEWIEALQRLSPTCEIHNHYGPTETTVGVLTYRVTAPLPATPSGTLPLGTPLPHTSILIVNGAGEIASAGEVGELWVGGAGVARGYLHRPDLTAEKFVTNPPHAADAGRWYRTGDLVRALPDGGLEFLGRIDDQIKVHGNRIEPGEIQATLTDVGGIRDAFVLARDDASGSKQLVAYIVPNRRKQPLWDRTSTYVLPDGAAVAHLNKSETDYIYNEIFVLQAYLRHGITVRDGDCIIDAGANIGLFTMFMNRLARDLTILAFEPNPAAFDCLAANTAASVSRVKCCPFGLSRENTAAEMTVFDGMSLLSGFYADAANERDVVRRYVLNQQADSLDRDGLAVQVAEVIDDRLHATPVVAGLRTLSTVIADERLERIDLLKINVEKSELDVLLGLADDDWLKIRQMVIEVDQEQNLDAIRALLIRHGFDLVVEQDALLRRTELCYVYAIRSSLAGQRLLRDQAPEAHVQRLSPPDPDILTPAALRRRLKDRLPQYMIPSAFVLLDKLPLNANGKIDRHALPAPSADPVSAVPAQIPPQSETELALAAIWRQLLNVPTVGAHDDFFDLGGQSLVAIQAVSRIRDAFGVNVSLRHLFERPTVAGLGELIDGLLWTAQRHGPRETEDREEIAL